MWFVSLIAMDSYHTNKEVIVVHEDGTSPQSICQALRLVREDLVRRREEDSYRISKAEYRHGCVVLRAKGGAQ